MRCTPARWLTGVLTSSSIAGRFLFGVPSIIAVVMNYARRAEAHGTWLETHFDWQIRTFWRALLWIAITLLVGGLLTLIVIGIFHRDRRLLHRRPVGRLPRDTRVDSVARASGHAAAGRHAGGGT